MCHYIVCDYFPSGEKRGHHTQMGRDADIIHKWGETRTSYTNGERRKHHTQMGRDADIIHKWGETPHPHYAQQLPSAYSQYNYVSL